MINSIKAYFKILKWNVRKTWWGLQDRFAVFCDLGDLFSDFNSLWLSNSLSSETQRHRFHLVSVSPWPLFAALGGSSFLTGILCWVHFKYLIFHPFFFGFLCTAFIMYLWFKDVIREGSYLGYHTQIVQYGLKFGFVLFLISEIMFFFSFFWGYFHSSLNPSIWIGGIWPPEGIVPYFFSEIIDWRYFINNNLEYPIFIEFGGNDDFGHEEGEDTYLTFNTDYNGDFLDNQFVNSEPAVVIEKDFSSKTSDSFQLMEAQNPFLYGKFSPSYANDRLGGEGFDGVKFIANIIKSNFTNTFSINLLYLYQNIRNGDLYGTGVMLRDIFLLLSEPLISRFGFFIDSETKAESIIENVMAPYTKKTYKVSSTSDIYKEKVHTVHMIKPNLFNNGETFDIVWWDKEDVDNLKLKKLDSIGSSLWYRENKNPYGSRWPNRPYFDIHQVFLPFYELKSYFYETFRKDKNLPYSAIQADLYMELYHYFKNYSLFKSSIFKNSSDFYIHPTAAKEYNSFAYAADTKVLENFDYYIDELSSSDGFDVEMAQYFSLQSLQHFDSIYFLIDRSDARDAIFYEVSPRLLNFMLKKPFVYNNYISCNIPFFAAMKVKDFSTEELIDSEILPLCWQWDVFYYVFYRLTDDFVINDNIAIFDEKFIDSLYETSIIFEDNCPNIDSDLLPKGPLFDKVPGQGMTLSSVIQQNYFQYIVFLTSLRSHHAEKIDYNSVIIGDNSATLNKNYVSSIRGINITPERRKKLFGSLEGYLTPVQDFFVLFRDSVNEFNLLFQNGIRKNILDLEGNIKLHYSSTSDVDPSRIVNYIGLLIRADFEPFFFNNKIYIVDFMGYWKNVISNFNFDGDIFFGSATPIIGLKSIEPVSEATSMVAKLDLTLFDFGCLVNPGTFPWYNTILLISSGFAVTASHIFVKTHYLKWCLTFLFVTLYLALFFLKTQVLEYIHAIFSINDGVFGSVFYMLTGFHGFHVLIGTILLIVCFARIFMDHFYKTAHLGYEVSIWYWHFVDVVWIGLYFFIYYWSSSYFFETSFEPGWDNISDDTRNRFAYKFEGSTARDVRTLQIVEPENTIWLDSSFRNYNYFAELMENNFENPVDFFGTSFHFKMAFFCKYNFDYRKFLVLSFLHTNRAADFVFADWLEGMIARSLAYADETYFGSWISRGHTLGLVTELGKDEYLRYCDREYLCRETGERWPWEKYNSDYETFCHWYIGEKIRYKGDWKGEV